MAPGVINIFTWIVVGGLAGWIGSIITGRSRRMGCLANVVVGILGGVVGGFVMSLLGRPITMGFSLPGLLVAVIGAVILLVLTGWWQGRRRR